MVLLHLYPRAALGLRSPRSLAFTFQRPLTLSPLTVQPPNAHTALQVRYWVAAVQAYAALMPPGLKRLVADLQGLSPVGKSSSGELRLGNASATAILDALKAASRGSGSSSSSDSGNGSGSSKEGGILGKESDVRRLSSTGVKGGKQKSKSRKAKAKGKGARSSARSTRRLMGVGVVVDALARWWAGGSQQ
mgnify:CR=1 FL=1